MFLLSRARLGAATRRTSGRGDGRAAAVAVTAPASPTSRGGGGGGGRGATSRPRARPRPRAAAVSVSAIFIDRRAALERQWQRQQRDAQLERADPPRGGVLDVRSLAHLERIVEDAARRASLVVVLFHSRSCGACGRARSALEALAAEAGAATATRPGGARPAFACVDVRDEYDHPSAAARLYRVRAVPSFAFFVDGALVRRLPLRDVPVLAHGRSPAQIRAALEEDAAGVRRAYRAALDGDAAAAALGAAPPAGGEHLGGGAVGRGQEQPRWGPSGGEA